MQNEQGNDVEALAHKKQENLEASLYQFLFVKNFFATPELACFAQVDKTWQRVVYKGLIDRYAENEGQRRLFTAIKDKNIKELSSVLDEEGHDPKLFEIDGFRTLTFQALVHRWLSYFPQHSGALLLVERIDMTRAERKLCLDVIHKDVANLDPILEAGTTLEGNIKLFNPFTYAELKRLERIYSIIKTQEGSIDELKRLLACPIGAFEFLAKGRRVGHAIWWARQFKNVPVLQFLNIENNLLEYARSRGDVGRVEFLLATGMQDELRWSPLKSVSFATTNFFANSANMMSQFVKSFWESEGVEKTEENGSRLDSRNN